MLVSIITICYNRQDTISKTIESVLIQDYPNIEYIIVDGNSNDGTTEIIRSYFNNFSNEINNCKQTLSNHILKNEAQKKPSTYRGLPVNYIIYSPK
jgi:glycosyltransferase